MAVDTIFVPLFRPKASPRVMASFLHLFLSAKPTTDSHLAKAVLTIVIECLVSSILVAFATHPPTRELQPSVNSDRRHSAQKSRPGMRMSLAGAQGLLED